MSCNWCDESDNLTTINGRVACVPHVGEAFKAVVSPVRQALADSDSEETT